VDYLSPNIGAYLQSEYRALSKKYSSGTDTGLVQWLLEEQNELEQDAALLGDGSFSEFVKYMSSTRSTALKPLEALDGSHTISNYFVSSSHNTFLVGNQLSSEASPDAYKYVGEKLHWSALCT
jgi:hypothetical protein